MDEQTLYTVTVENLFPDNPTSGGDWLSIEFGPFSSKREVQTCVKRIKASRKDHDIGWDKKKMMIGVHTTVVSGTGTVIS